MKKTGLIILILTLLALTLGGALAENVTGLTFVSENGASFTQDGRNVDRVELIKRGETYYLFLPKGWDRAKLCACYDFEGMLTADAGKEKGIPVPNGAPTAAFASSDEVKIRRESGKLLCNIKLMQGSLPAIFLQTQNNSLSNIHKDKENREPASLVMTAANGQPVHAGLVTELKARGNNTFNHVKKPYQFKLYKKADLLGSGKAKTYVLLADYLDYTLLRNRVTLDVARYIGLRYSVASQSVDLFIDGEYKGVYLLTDKVEIGESRINIYDQEDAMEALCDQPLDSYPVFREKLEAKGGYGGYELPKVPDDITGGYLLEIDKAYRVQSFEKCRVFTPQGMGILIEEPDQASREQVTYLKDILYAFNRAIRQKDGVDTVTGKRYTELFDLDSLVLKFLLEEMSMNYDAKAGSQYFYKDRDSVDPLIYAGPSWDYDLAYANCLYTSPYEPYLTKMTLDWPWWTYLYKQENFKARAQELVEKRMIPALEILVGKREAEAGDPLRSMEAYEQEIGESSKMNFVRWKPGTIKGNNKRMGSGHKEGLELMTVFLTKRIVGLSRTFLGLKN